MVEQALPAAEQYGGDRQVHLVDEASFQVLLDGRRPAPKPDVLSIGRFERSLECRFDAVGDEVERRPALHRDRLMRMVREHEHWMVIWRGGAPTTPTPTACSS